MDVFRTMLLVEGKVRVSTHFMPPAVKKPAAAPSQVDAVPFKATAVTAGKAVAGKAVPAKNAALAAVTAALAATAASAAPQKAAAAVLNQAVAGDDQKPRRWIVKKTLNKFKTNLRSVPDYYLPKFIQLIAAEVAPRCDGDQQLSRLERSSLVLAIVFCLRAVTGTSSSPQRPLKKTRVRACWSPRFARAAQCAIPLSNRSNLAASPP